MQALTVARPYARAAFAIARDEDKLAVWSDALAFAARVSADPRVAALLPNPQLSSADALTLLAPDNAGESFCRFLAALGDAQRLQALPEIAGLYDEMRADAEKRVKARITSAAELPAGELEVLRAALKKRFGREVEIDTAVDESLIGGAVIDTGDVVIDGSLKGKLARLQTALAN